ncbi:MAG: redoxin domain-containing protein [Planctomycetota bacterium]|nr:redoxin domain-containing protein [Planctomycetota bacterium]
MKLMMTTSVLGALCISTMALAQDSIPAIPLEKPKPAPKVEPLPEPTPLFVGDNAPALTIDHWVKGDSVDGFNDGQVYVVEFWATWCGPCVYGMPHLSDLQDEWGDKVKIIGVTSEKETKIVTDFLEKTNSSDGLVNNDRMRYTVAVDPDRTTSNVYMKAAGQNGIPTAFIVDGSGKVAWIGHPMSMDDPLKQVVEGNWDIAAAAKEFKLEAEREKQWSAFVMVYREAMANDDWDGVIEAIDSFSDEFGSTQSLQNMKFEALLNNGSYDEAYVIADEMTADSWDDAMALNSIAWNNVDSMPEEHRNIEFALKVATRANTLTKGKDPMILDTLARVYWERGDIYKAIAWQTKAVQNTKDGEPMSDSIRATLDEYKATLANVNNGGMQ